MPGRTSTTILPMQGLSIRDHWRRRWFGLAFVGALAAAAWWIIRYQLGGTGFDGWPFYLLLAGFAVVMSLFVETGINGVTKRVARRRVFLGIVPLWSSRSGLEEFSGVVVAAVMDSDSVSSWFVQLARESSGRRYFVTWSDDLSEARSIAESIAGETGLPVIVEGVDEEAN